MEELKVGDEVETITGKRGKITRITGGICPYIVSCKRNWLFIENISYSREELTKLKSK